MARRSSLTEEKAKWFVRTILEREFNYLFDRQHLKAAKEIAQLDWEVVQICLEDMKRGCFGWDRPVTSLYCVTWGEPPYYQRMLDKIRDIPPPYEVCHYDNWVRKYGKIAKILGYWDGVYQGYVNPLEKPFRMPVEELADLLVELA